MFFDVGVVVRHVIAECTANLFVSILQIGDVFVQFLYLPHGVGHVG